MNSDYDDFFAEPIVQEIVNNVEDDSMDSANKAFEICHGLMSYASDYNCSDPKLQAIWALLNKHKYEDSTYANWEENPYGKDVYDYLVRTLSPNLAEESWAKHNS